MCLSPFFFRGFLAFPPGIGFCNRDLCLRGFSPKTLGIVDTVRGFRVAVHRSHFSSFYIQHAGCWRSWSWRWYRSLL